MSRSPRVIAVQMPMTRKAGVVKPAFDFGPAEQYGELEILASNGNHILTPDVFRHMLEKSLADFDPETDYIIPAGDYAVLFFVGMILGDRFKTIRILRWVPDAKAYQPLSLDIRR
ncbi:MAG: hypothetical protein U1E51_16890 [Candidatus Binatia bacterium]|nr:hypothetical protein [Candidatus Binatia bacterium]